MVQTGDLEESKNRNDHDDYPEDRLERFWNRDDSEDGIDTPETNSDDN